MFCEPPRTQADLNFSLFGIPVRVHPFFWLFLAIIGGQRDLSRLLLWLLAGFVSVLVHELGHAFVMRAFGRQPWITLYSFGGLASYDPRWGSGRYVPPWGEIAISAAGPGMEFLLTAVICVVHTLLGGSIYWAWYLYVIPMPILLVVSPTLSIFLTYLVFVSMVWGVFNLLPVYPLDGGHITRDLFAWVHPRSGIQWSMILSTVLASGIAVYSLYQLGKTAQGSTHRLEPVDILNSSNFYMFLLFGVLAYQNYQAYQAYTGRRSLF